VKPGDHPEFFRLPPPPGASRESTIRLDRDGTFYHDGTVVTKDSLVRALHSWVSFHPDDGRPILTNGYDWTYFTVDDTPYFVEAVRGAPPGAPTLVLSDGTEEALDPSSVVVDDDGTCFVRVKNGRAWARFWRLAQIGLAPFILEDDPPRLAIGGVEHPIGRRPPRSQ
jgi:uncharacterized protein